MIKTIDLILLNTGRYFMNYAVEGIYKNGSIELIEKPKFHKPVQVLVLFLENKNKIRNLQ